jgi:hypothetical protein
VHHAEMMCRDPALVLQEKLLDLEHNPDDCMYATRDVRPISDFWVALCEWRDSQCANTHSFDSVLDTRKKALAYGCP